MRYIHVKNTDSGVVHVRPQSQNLITCCCGRILSEIFEEETDEEVTCGQCKRVLWQSRTDRLASQAAVAVERLLQDKRNRPGAYIHIRSDVLEDLQTFFDAYHTDLGI